MKNLKLTSACIQFILSADKKAVGPMRSVGHMAKWWNQGAEHVLYQSMSEIGAI